MKNLLSQLPKDIKAMIDLSREIGEWTAHKEFSSRTEIKGYDPKRSDQIEAKLNGLRDQIREYEDKWLND